MNRRALFLRTIASCLLLVLSAVRSLAQPDDTALRQRFDKVYEAFHARMTNDSRVQISSTGGAKYYRAYPEYEEILKLGRRSVPFWIAKIRQSDFPAIEFVERFSQVKFRSSKHVLEWWDARALLRETFEARYTSWKRCKHQPPFVLETTEELYDESTKRIERTVKRTALGQAYDALHELGVDALPFIAQNLKDGDCDLLPLMAELTYQQAVSDFGTLAQRRQEALNWWSEHKFEWTIPPPSGK